MKDFASLSQGAGDRRQEFRSIQLQPDKSTAQRADCLVQVRATAAQLFKCYGVLMIATMM